MPAVINDVIQVRPTFRVTAPPTITQNVYHFKISDLVSGVDADVATDLNTKLDAMMTTIEGFFDINYVLQDVRIVNLTQRTFIRDGVEFPWTGGLADVDVMPGQIAVEVVARSFSLGHLGRKYLGPVVEQTFTDGELVPLAVTAFGNYLNLYDSNFAGALTGNTYLPGTVRMVGGVVAEFKPFVSTRGRVFTTARTMRSRIPGRGLS